MSTDRKEKRPGLGLSVSNINNNQRDEQEPEKEIVKKQSEKGTCFQKPSEQNTFAEERMINDVKCCW